MMNEHHSRAGFLRRLGVNTKMPVPMMAPTPSIMS